MANKILMTQEGFNQHLKRIQDAKFDLNDVLRARGEASVLSDDTLIDEEIAKKNATLYSLESMTKDIVIVQALGDSDTIDIGCIVTVEISDGKENETFKGTLIATEITDFESQISINGPLGKAIRFKKKGDVVTYEVRGSSHITKYQAKILEIE